MKRVLLDANAHVAFKIRKSKRSPHRMPGGHDKNAFHSRW